MTGTSFNAVTTPFDIQLSGANTSYSSISFPGPDLTIDAAKSFPTAPTSDSYNAWFDKVYHDEAQLALQANLTFAEISDGKYQAVTVIQIEVDNDVSDVDDYWNSKYADEWEQCAIGINTLFTAQASPASEATGFNSTFCTPVFGNDCYSAIRNSLYNATLTIQNKVNSTKDLCSQDLAIDTPSECSEVFSSSEISFSQYSLSGSKPDNNQPVFSRSVTSESDVFYYEELAVIYPVGVITYYSSNSAWKNVNNEEWPLTNFEFMCLQLQSLEGDRITSTITWPATDSSNPEGYQKISSATTLTSSQLIWVAVLSAVVAGVIGF